MRLLKSFKQSLRRKLLISLLLIGSFPFIVLFIYTIFFTKTKIVNQTIQQQVNRTKVVINLIDVHLNQLQKELGFLASLDIMDDILVEDIDKRISIILEKKVNDIDLDVQMYALDLNKNIIASSQKTPILTKLPTKKIFSQTNQYFFSLDHLYIYSKLYASFNATKETGYLLLKYNLKNLNRYLIHEEGMHSYLVNNTQDIHIGDQVELHFKITQDSGSTISDKHLIVYQNTLHLLKNFYLVYAVDKDIALKTVNDFIKFMSYVSVLILFFLLYFALKYSKSIVQPIKNLTIITQEIIKNKNYKLSLDIETEDEIGSLSYAFNEMLHTTSRAIDELKAENEFRLQRFIQLVDIFNKIIQTQNNQECISISIEAIKKLANNENVTYSPKKQSQGIDIFVNNFEKGTKSYFGSISLEFKDENEHRFYNSIVTMISLQLERIDLISKTMEISKAKSAFISNMSHELRTPLNSIIGSTQYLITYEEATDNQLDALGSIESSAQYLLNMINDILDMAKIEAGKMSVHLQTVNLEEILQESYYILKPLAEEKNLNFILSKEALKLTHFLTDPKMFQQIIINLLSNAIKFTQYGKITFKVFNTEDTLTIEIIDEGIGIESSNLNKLFTEFSQIETLMHKTNKGTGLGLVLSQKMANLLNASLSLQSQGLNQGTTARLIFKL